MRLYAFRSLFVIMSLLTFLRVKSSQSPLTFEVRPSYRYITLFVGSDSGATNHKSIAVSSDTVLLVEKARGVQIGTRDLLDPSHIDFRVGRFVSIATAARPLFRHLITSTRDTRGRRLRSLC